jgi:hypothetical protein
VLSQTFSEEEAATKIPAKIKSIGFVSRAWLCHEHKITVTVNKFFFAKKEWPQEAQNILCNTQLLLFESGPNQAQTHILSVLLNPDPCKPVLCSPVEVL